jgi:hypothetical protein
VSREAVRICHIDYRRGFEAVGKTRRSAFTNLTAMGGREERRDFGAGEKIFAHLRVEKK